MNPKKITPCIWFDNEAEEAVQFYTSLFSDSKIDKITRFTDEGTDIHGMEAGTVMTVGFQLGGQPFTALNGGPHFKVNPCISFFVMCETVQEVDHLWSSLLPNGKVMFELDKYPWSEKYGWLQDQYGVSWQISAGKIEDVGQKITPTLMFVNDQFGNAEEAIEHYTSIFKNSEVDGILRYGPDEEGPKGLVKHAQFKLEDGKFMIMDGPGEHEFDFNEGISLVVHCNSKEEVDYYWEKLNQGGDPKAQQCGWLKDKYGVSWQVVPTELYKMLDDDNTEKVKRVTKVMLQMKKLDLNKLREAYDG
tara:strand:+ start:13503 stop:14414 length:912 start_codon:yes stop_codon:yes gene_type:complete